jgi:hypothetical protein
MATIPADILDRIRALERAVRDLSGRASTRPALTRVADGTVRVEDGGQLVVVPPGQDFATFAVGQWDNGQFGTVLRRMDGSFALTVEGDDDAGRGMLRVWSRDTAAAERVLVGDDPHSGRFLGRPHLPLYLYPTAEQRSTSEEWANAWTGIGPAHNAVAIIKVSSYAEDGGRVRVRMRHSADEAAVIDEWDVPADAWTNRTITRPLHGVGYLADIACQIEHRTSGRHPIETRVFAAYTRGTLTPDEAPDPPAGRAPDASATTDPRLDVESDDQGEENNDAGDTTPT